MHSQKQKKISLSSAVFLAITSMVGAGIFIKTQTLNTLSHNSITPIIFLLFIFLLNLFSFSYVLIKIIPSQTGNMGFMEWSRKFCSPKIDACFSNFVRFFYHPVSLVIFSVYGVSGVLGERVDIGVIAVLFLSFLVVVLVMAINLISFQWAKRIQFVLWILVLIPLISLPLIGMFGSGEDAVTVPVNPPTPTRATGIDSFGPWMLLISGLPSALFIYDGFYNLAVLKDKLESPKYLTLSLLISFFVVTLLYIYVMVGFNVGSPETANYKDFPIFRNNTRPYLKEMFEVLVGCASFLTLNSIALSNIPQLKAMHKANGFGDVNRFSRFIFYKKHVDHHFQTKFSIWVYLLAKTFVWFFVTGILAILVNKLSKTNNGLMQIMDSLADITSVFVFVILVTIIIKSFRRKNVVLTPKFRFCALTSSSLIIIALSYLVISYVIGCFGYAGAPKMASFTKVLFLVLFFMGSFYKEIHSFFDRIFNRRKYILFPTGKEGSITTFK